jgi:hypothetical protein
MDVVVDDADGIDVTPQTNHVVGEKLSDEK